MNIQNQSKTLSQQCETLRKQLRRQDNLEQDRSRDIVRLRKKHEAGRQNTTVAVMAHFGLDWEGSMLNFGRSTNSPMSSRPASGVRRTRRERRANGFCRHCPRD